MVWIFLEYCDVFGIWEFSKYLEWLECGVVKCCCVLWNCIAKRGLESTRHLKPSKKNSKCATRNPLGFESWECGFVKYCFVLWNLYCLKRMESQRQFKNFEVMFEFACF